MQLSHTLVITVQEGKKIFRKITLIKFTERTHDTDINEHDAWVLIPVTLICRCNKNIARMHIRMKVAATEPLYKKYFNPGLGQPFQINPGCHEAINITNRNTRDAFHDHDILMGKWPLN